MREAPKVGSPGKSRALSRRVSSKLSSLSTRIMGGQVAADSYESLETYEKEYGYDRELESELPVMPRRSRRKTRQVEISCPVFEHCTTEIISVEEAALRASRITKRRSSLRGIGSNIPPFEDSDSERARLSTSQDLVLGRGLGQQTERTELMPLAANQSLPSLTADPDTDTDSSFQGTPYSTATPDTTPSSSPRELAGNFSRENLLLLQPNSSENDLHWGLNGNGALSGGHKTQMVESTYPEKAKDEESCGQVTKSKTARRLVPPPHAGTTLDLQGRLREAHLELEQERFKVQKLSAQLCLQQTTKRLADMGTLREIHEYKDAIGRLNEVRQSTTADLENKLAFFRSKEAQAHKAVVQPAPGQLRELSIPKLVLNHQLEQGPSARHPIRMRGLRPLLPIYAESPVMV